MRATSPLILLVALGALGCRSRPPVLWIVMDTVRADHLALYGGRVHLPKIEAFARQALVFEQASSNFPETQYSHWSMFTGVLPEIHGNIPQAGTSGYTGPTLGQALGSKGYKTAAFIGGATLKASACGLDRGFQLYDDHHLMAPPFMARPSLEVATRTRDWIAAADRPYFAFSHYFDAHFPYMPSNPRRYDPIGSGRVDGTDETLSPYRDFGAPMPPQDLEHVVALYDAEIAEMDNSVGDLLASLSGDEIVIITSDHGESFEHGYLFNHRAVLYESVLHVPLIIKAPGLAAGREPTPVELLDLFPTVLELAGLGVDAPIQGRSLVEPDPNNKAAFRPIQVPSPAPRAYGRTDPFLEAPLLSLRSASWKVIWEEGEPRAYALDVDPQEQRPLAPPDLLLDGPGDYARRLAELTAYHKTLPARLPPPELPPPDRRAPDAQQLKALGYVDHGQPPQNPPSAPGTQR